MGGIEDSANAIFTIVVASCASTGRVRQGFSSHFVPWCCARSTSQIPRDKLSAEHFGDPSIESMRMRKSMNPFAAEFFGQAVLRRLGIRTAPQIICSSEEASALAADYVVKIAGENCLDLLCNLNFSVPMAKHLNWKPGAVPSGWCLASRLIPDAATMDYISRKLIVSHDARTQVLRQCAELHATKDMAIDELIAKTLGKTCISADVFFAEFRPTSTEIERIKRAMALDGPQYLEICAARVFCGCSAPHYSNALVTMRGELVSIDHARACFEDGEDLQNLFYFVTRSSEAFKILGRVSALTEDDIRKCVSEIPKHPAVGSTNGLADYYVQRLQLWKQLHAKELSNSTSMTVGPKSAYSTASAAVGGRQILDEAARLARAWK